MQPAVGCSLLATFRLMNDVVNVFHNCATIQDVRLREAREATQGVRLPTMTFHCCEYVDVATDQQSEGSALFQLCIRNVSDANYILKVIGSAISYYKKVESTSNVYVKRYAAWLQLYFRYGRK